MKRYENPDFVTLINCGCERCKPLSPAGFIRTWGEPDADGYVCGLTLPPPDQDVPNRLYGATINHEGDAV
jgi:hypothetical protein